MITPNAKWQIPGFLCSIYIYTTRFLTQERSGPSILSWNPAFGANLRFRAENQINKYLPSALHVKHGWGMQGNTTRSQASDNLAREVWQTGNSRESMFFTALQKGGKYSRCLGLWPKEWHTVCCFWRDSGHLILSWWKEVGLAGDTQGDAVITK